MMMLSLATQSNALPPLRVKDQGFVDGTGRAFEFHGVNWFGFGNKQTMVDGLWIGGSSVASDFFSIVYRIKLLGFNSVRLPFTFDDLNMKPLDKRIECRIDSIGRLINSTLPPWRIPELRKRPVSFIGTLPRKACNEGLDNRSTKHRFIQVIKTFVDNDIYVVLDYHPMGSEPYAWQGNGGVVATKWKQLMEWIIRECGGIENWNRFYGGRVLIDIMNEPDSMRLGWRPTSQLYMKTMDALWPLLGRQGSLFLVEGTGQVGYGLNWGDGFITDKKAIRETGIDDAAVFLREVVKKPYINGTIISPHMYGPTVMLNDRASYGLPLRDRMWKSYLYLWKYGYAGKKYPIVLGEFGSTFRDPRDIRHLNDLPTYFVSGKHWMWWCWNSNSGDTGGLVKTDWMTLEWDKLRYLIDRWGLRPWWM